MRKQSIPNKTFHGHILKEAQLIDTLDALMIKVSHPKQLTELSEEDIQRMAVGTTSTTKQLRATLQLAHLLAVPQRRQHFTVRLPRDVVQYCRENIINNSYPITYLIGLNTKNMVATTERIPVETMQCLTTYQRAIFRHLIIHKCASVILVHMRSADEINPSHEEINLTKQIASTGDVIGISLLDAILMTHSNYVSFKESGWL
ncbi:JAB domain-containing protein [Brevibacillus agri]